MVYPTSSCSKAVFFNTRSFSNNCVVNGFTSSLSQYTAYVPTFPYAGAVRTTTFKDSASCFTNPVSITWASPGLCQQNTTDFLKSYTATCAGSPVFTYMLYAQPQCGDHDDTPATVVTTTGTQCGAGGVTTTSCVEINTGFLAFTYYDDPNSCGGTYYQYGQALGLCENVGYTDRPYAILTSSGAINGYISVTYTYYSDSKCLYLVDLSSVSFPVGCPLTPDVGYSFALLDAVPTPVVTTGYLTNTYYATSSTCGPYTGSMTQDSLQLGGCAATSVVGRFISTTVTGLGSTILRTDVFYQGSACLVAGGFETYTYSSACLASGASSSINLYTNYQPTFPISGSLETDTYASSSSCSYAPIELLWTSPDYCFPNKSNSYKITCAGANTFTYQNYVGSGCSVVSTKTTAGGKICGVGSSAQTQVCVGSPTMAPVVAPTPGSPTRAPTSATAADSSGGSSSDAGLSAGATAGIVIVVLVVVGIVAGYVYLYHFKSKSGGLSNSSPLKKSLLDDDTSPL